MNDFLKDFGNRVKFYRQLRGLSQEKLGELADVSTKTVSEWETGKSFIEYPTLVRLCNALSIEPSMLFNTPPENAVDYQKQTLDISNLSKPQIELLQKLISEFRKSL